MANSKAVDTSYVLKCSAHLVQQNLKYLQTVLAQEGMETTKLVSINFLASYVGIILHRALTEKPPSLFDKKAIFEFTQENFSEMKSRVQDAVAAGFTGAMNAFSGKDLDYYCSVKPVGPPLNKDPI